MPDTAMRSPDVFAPGWRNRVDRMLVAVESRLLWMCDETDV